MKPGASNPPQTTLLLNAADVARVLRMDDVITVVADAFRAHARGEAQMPAKSYILLPERQGDFRSMPAQVGDAAAVKWVNVHPRNPTEYGMPSVLATLILGDVETGFPLAVMDATLITAYRTAASAAAATNALARKDAATLGIIGAGGQAAFQIAAVSRVRNFTKLVIADARPEAANALAERVRAMKPAFTVVTGTIQEAAGCDVIVTITPVAEPIVQREWIRAGTHINAMGADAPGKEELDPFILRAARIFVDDWEQASHSGEINVPLEEGTITKEHVVGSLGALLQSSVPGRLSESDITIFDSTGLAIQDAAVAKLVYERAVKENIGANFRFSPGGDVKAPDVLAELRV